MIELGTAKVANKLIDKMGQNKNKFAIIGVGGYIAPRHLGAVKNTGGSVVAACDVSDSVGIIDSYFPDADFTTDPKAFLSGLKECGADYLTVCTPNFRHCSHSETAMKAGLDVICEKPVVMTCEEHYRLTCAEAETGKRVFPVLHMRLHQEAARIREKIQNDGSGKSHEVELVYIAPRGKWYAASWKGDVSKSGGVLTNIGIHFIDLLHWLFGHRRDFILHYSAPDCVSGVLELDRARVSFFLSVNPSHLPENHTGAWRHFTIDGDSFDFSAGFANLHDLTYNEILAGRGFSLADTFDAIETVEEARHLAITHTASDYHPLLRRVVEAGCVNIKPML